MIPLDSTMSRQVEEYNNDPATAEGILLSTVHLLHVCSSSPSGTASSCDNFYFHVALLIPGSLGTGSIRMLSIERMPHRDGVLCHHKETHVMYMYSIASRY
jgi:hypothetical protein